MIKFFYRIQYWIEKIDIKILSKISYRFLLHVIRIIVPIYYRIFPSQKSGIEHNKERDKHGGPKLIISVTTFPPRMQNLWIVLESLLRQSHKPDKIILWLAKSQFPSIEDVDLKVRRMQKRGLEIRFCEDVKSHKKYLFAMQEFSEDIIITVDDDIFHPEDLVENLFRKSIEYPGNIVCYRAHKITFQNGKINDYLKWDRLSKGMIGPDHLLMATNGAGVLYPPNSLSEEAFNIDSIQKLCPNADDIWLKCMGYIKGTKTVKVFKSFPEVFTTKNSHASGLAKVNVVGGNNDIQLKNVMDFYNIDFNREYNLVKSVD